MRMEESKYVGVQYVEALEVEEGSPTNTASSPVGTFEVASSAPTATKVNDYENKPEYRYVTVTWEKGEVHSSEYRDKGFAITFITRFIILLGLSLSLGPTAWVDANETS